MIKIFKKWKITWRDHHFTQMYQKSWSYAILSLRYGLWRMQFLFFILGYLLPFYSPNNPKYKNFKKIKKSTWRYHFTKAESNLELWGSIQNLYKRALWAKFYPKIPWHNTIFGKKGTFLLNITARDSVWLPMLISFELFLEKCIKNHDHMLYCPWDMAYNRCNCYFSFWANFCPFTP